MQQEQINWDQLSQYGRLRAVIDPHDEMGYKNMLIDRVHWIAIKRQLKGCRHLLDLGCGTGRFAKRIEHMGIHYRGIDSSLGMITAAKQHHPQSAQLFKTFDGINIPYDEATFDVILCTRVWIHTLQLSNFNAMLLEIKRVLKPGGHLVLLEEASLSNRKSGQARWVLLEEDFTKVLNDDFLVCDLHRVRSSEFSKFARHITEVPGLAYLWFRLLLTPLARYEALRIRCLSNRYFAKVTYYDFLIHAILKNK